MNSQIKPKEYTNHTSVSLKLKHKDILEKTAQKYEISMNDLMILLLRYVNEQALTIFETQARIKYQQPEGNIKIVNLYIGQRDYERNLDARRYGKVSVSWLLAYAIEHFLDLVLQMIFQGFARGKEILNNCVGLQTFLVKKMTNRIRMVSIWYPQKEKKYPNHHKPTKKQNKP